MTEILKYITPTIVFPILLFASLIYFFLYYLGEKRVPKTIAAVPGEASGAKHKISLVSRIHPVTKGDMKIIAVITAVYAAVAFWGLGNVTAPKSFYSFEGKDYNLTIILNEAQPVSEFKYYSGLYTGDYILRYSEDGVKWSEATTLAQSYDKLFSWRSIEFSFGTKMRYIQIWSRETPLEMGEVGLLNERGKLIPSAQIQYSNAKASKLFDEQSTAPQSPSYMNSMYFDEIYHGRTAYENIENVYPYEISHPPLGKLIISLGIKLFGMTPFGWRFMGVLFGVLMLPFMFAFIKNLFGKSLIATCGTLLFAFDFMHFVQTRIATIDTYGVFFILLMFYFMYRYIALDYDAPFKEGLKPLALSGLSFGLGAASKWIVIYGAMGLAVLWLIRQVLVWRHRAENGTKNEFLAYFVRTLLFSALFFVVIPVIIYILSYIPYGAAKGMTIGKGMLWNKEFYKIIIENQKFMFGYHSKLVATHPYSSPWYSWLLDIRPILYYLDYLPEGRKSAFGAFGNPVLWWGGLMALIYAAKRFVTARDFKALFIIIGYLAQLLPWVLISRVVFIYHYFPSTIFLVLATCYAFRCMYKKGKGYYELAILGYTAVSLVLFAAFYPVLTGVATPQWYTTHFLQWIPSAWPF